MDIYHLENLKIVQTTCIWSILVVGRSPCVALHYRRTLGQYTSKPVESKLHDLVHFLLLTNHCNHTVTEKTVSTPSSEALLKWDHLDRAKPILKILIVSQTETMSTEEVQIFLKRYCRFCRAKDCKTISCQSCRSEKNPAAWSGSNQTRLARV